MTGYGKDTFTLMDKLDGLLKKEKAQIKILEFKGGVCDIILQIVENVQKEISGKDARYVELKLSGMYPKCKWREEIVQPFHDLVSSFPDISVQSVNDQLDSLVILQIFISLMAEQMKKGDNRDFVDRELAKMRAAVHEERQKLMDLIKYKNNTLAVRVAVESLPE